MVLHPLPHNQITRRISITLFLSILGVLGLQFTTPSLSSADDWPGFRGENAAGVARGNQTLPAEIGLDTNLLWKADVPEGISSPAIANGRVFLTTMESGSKVGTIALDAKSGNVLWHVHAPIARSSKAKRLATPTPVSDGKLVFSFFDSAGLFCYDTNGKQLWHKDFGPLKNQFNHSASPILIGELLVLLIDHDGHSFLTALNKSTGEEVWRCHRFVFGRNYASPIRWSFGGRDYIVVTGSGLVTGYEVKSGTPAWYIRGTSAVVNPTPVVGENGYLFVHGTSPPSGAKMSPFSDLRKTYDTNDDDELQTSELPHSFLKTFFKRFDKDSGGGVDATEYTTFLEFSQPFHKGLAAFKPGGTGDLTETNVAWTESRSMPRTPSAIHHNGMLFLVSEGGVLQSFAIDTGELLSKGRIGARGNIYSSPALGDGKIYVGTRDGEVAILSAEAEPKNLHTAVLGGDIQASVAIANGRVYFRTDTSLFCFGLK